MGLEAGAGVVHRLSDHSAVVARHLLHGDAHPYSEEEYEFIVGALLEENLVETQDRVLLTRRTLFRAGAGAAMGISLLMLPTAAMAASGGGAFLGDAGSTPAPSAVATDSTIVTNWN